MSEKDRVIKSAVTKAVLENKGIASTVNAGLESNGFGRLTSEECNHIGAIIDDLIEVNPVDSSKDFYKGRKCPRCGQEYYEPSALSRRDNKTEICPACGVAEALEDMAGHGVAYTGEPYWEE